MHRPPHVTGHHTFLDGADMRRTQPGLIMALAHHCWGFLSLRGEWKLMPDSIWFVWIAMIVASVGGMSEQLVRGRSLGLAMISTLVWIGFIVTMSMKGRVLNRRLAAALALLSIAIQGLLILSTWIPACEWPIAIWSGIAVMHLLSQANSDGATGAWR